ncbi:fructose-1,6-bisphosphatase [Enterococcus asini]|uniref:fructose-1,6-bisphosphatase n=1 Tax=Enterococcus asini TaxID=57732 RepID=UPI0028925FE1|nr:fructose-1,6-bisphosphatase [Enterococcus asini]MDT2756097.1 fructose-1,6-bisphosphatase [Enterococcus asini]
MNAKNYYELLYKEFQCKEDIYTELINLEAILNLPKGTEHYISDLHGEAAAFAHILKNGAGNIREKLFILFDGRKKPEYLEQLALFIYYPKESLARKTSFSTTWYTTRLSELIEFTKFCANKYSRSKLRKALPQSFSYLLEELIYRREEEEYKELYDKVIINKLIQLGQIDQLLIALCQTIQRLVVDHLHVVGDIFDRGAAADQVMDLLINHHSVDIQWGNHDIIWLGAFAGSAVCLMNLLRIAARYNYLYEIEDSYGLNLRPLFSYGEKHYQKNPAFTPSIHQNKAYDFEDLQSLEKVHQALTILQFKLEGQLIKRRPDLQLDNRLLLEQVDFANQRVRIDNQWYPLTNTCFQTIDPTSPYELTKEEERVVNALLASFQSSEKMSKHMNFLAQKGSMYLRYNGQLLFHGCLPLSTTGEFQSVKIKGQHYAGKELLDVMEQILRQGLQNPQSHTDFATDFYWYAWCGRFSPLFGKDKMTTFERYFIDDVTTHQEVKNPYYQLRNQKAICEMILETFGLTHDNAHIINGHTPVKAEAGESPIKAEGKLFVIDGGLSKAYQKTTGIAGYTLLYNSIGFQIVTHQPFTSVADVLTRQKEDLGVKHVVDKIPHKTLIRDTTIGRRLLRQINDLEHLLAYLEAEPLKNTM